MNTLNATARLQGLQDTVHMHALRHYRPLIGVLTVMVLLYGALLLKYYQEGQEIAQSHADMEAYLSEWKEKNNLLNQSSMRPITKKQVQQVPTDLLFQMQAQGLNLIRMSEIPPRENEAIKGRAFVVTMQGSYEDTMRLLQNFHAKDALIGIRDVKMEARGGQIETQLIYQIYTKGEADQNAAAKQDVAN